MRVVRASHAESAALEIGMTHALLRRVAAGGLEATARLYRPRATVAFGRLDALRPGFDGAVATARAHGFEPVLRLAGGRAAAYHEQSLGLDLVLPQADAFADLHAPFRLASELLSEALRSLGVDARVGEVAGEYCPGAFSVNARGRVKLVGTAQRRIRGAAVVAAAVVVRDGAPIREVLAEVYRHLEVDFDPATVGTVADELAPADVAVADVERALLGALAAREALVDAPLDAETDALAASLAQRHRLAG
jgi:octanoyl-[GcvH]:protein N-octanoyltransferase